MESARAEACCAKLNFFNTNSGGSNVFNEVSFYLVIGFFGD